MQTLTLNNQKQAKTKDITAQKNSSKCHQTSICAQVYIKKPVSQLLSNWKLNLMNECKYVYIIMSNPSPLLKEPVIVRGLIKKSDILITETTSQESQSYLSFKSSLFSIIFHWSCHSAALV